MKKKETWADKVVEENDAFSPSLFSLRSKFAFSRCTHEADAPF